MNGMHARRPKGFVLEERLDRYAAAIEASPTAFRGHWAEACAPLGTEPFGRVIADMGCGKGRFACAMAAADPSTLVVGIDGEPVCIAYAAQKACEEGLSNLVFVPGRADQLADVFGPGELSALHINFPTPYPRKKDAPLRILAFDRLVEYRVLLAPDAQLRLKTDSEPLFRFATEMLGLAGYSIVWSSAAGDELPDEPATEYELRLAELGAKVHALGAVPASEPCEAPPLYSLYDYLPEDIEDLDYVPYGMGPAVENLRNYRAAHEGEDWRGALR